MSEVEQIWEEIAHLKAQLENLRLKREVLASHANELRDMHNTLKAEAQRAEELANKIDGM